MRNSFNFLSDTFVDKRGCKIIHQQKNWNHPDENALKFQRIWSGPRFGEFTESRNGWRVVWRQKDRIFYFLPVQSHAPVIGSRLAPPEAAQPPVHYTRSESIRVSSGGATVKKHEVWNHNCPHDRAHTWQGGRWWIDGATTPSWPDQCGKFFQSR